MKVGSANGNHFSRRVVPLLDLRVIKEQQIAFWSKVQTEKVDSLKTCFLWQREEGDRKALPADEWPEHSCCFQCCFHCCCLWKWTRGNLTTAKTFLFQAKEWLVGQPEHCLMHVVLLCTWRKLLGQHHAIGAAHLGEFILRVRLGCTCLVAPDCHLQFRCTFIEGYSRYRTQKDDRCLCTRMNDGVGWWQHCVGSQ